MYTDRKIASMFKALGDETRAKIFHILKGGKLCGCKILEEFDITQPTLSYHMKILEDSGLIKMEKKGIWHHYSINEESAKALCGYLCNEYECKKEGSEYER